MSSTTPTGSCRTRRVNPGTSGSGSSASACGAIDIMCRARAIAVFTAPLDGAAEAPVRGRGRPHRRRKNDADSRPVQAVPRARALRDRRGEPLPLQFLPGPPEVRVPDTALLPALPLQAAAGSLPAGSVQQRDDLGLPVRQGPDL